MSLTLHYQKALGTATDITFEYILSLANLWLVSIARLTSEPLEIIVKW
jgi:hypothetical protein